MTIDRGGKVIAVPYAALADRGVVEVATPLGPVVVFWAAGTASALDATTIDAGRDAGATGVFEPIAGGRRLTISRSVGPGAIFTDAETGSTWSVTGQATAGPLAGSQLEPVVHGDHFWFAWAAFEPATEIWSAP